MLHLYLKRFLLAVLAISFSCNLFAQEQVVDESKKKLDDQYDRNSVSIVVVSNNSHYQNDIYELVNNLFDGKFDKNNIATTQVQFEPQTEGAYETKLDGKLNNMNIGKEILAYWLNRQPNGKMDDERFQTRANYNATDEDVIHAAASQVSSIYEDGLALIDNSYVVAVKCDVERKITKDKKGNSTESYNSEMSAYVYQLIFDKADLENVFTTMWIEDTDDAATKEAKLKLWDDLKVQMRRVAMANSRGTDIESTKLVNGKSVKVPPTARAAIEDACPALLRKLEKKIPEWQVKAPVYTTHPITAKIGKKEGLRNGSRYKVFQYIEDENGELSLKKKGFVRATTIADNKTVATGESPTSRFYQIAGTRLEEGMLLRQANDLKIGVSAGPNIGGLGFLGGSVDYLLKINNAGFCSYAIVGLGYDLVELSYQSYGTTYVLEDKVGFLNLDLGYGLGVPLTRLFEIRPSVSVGIDAFSLEGSDEDKAAEYSAMYVKPALRFSWQVYYPVRLFLQADYSFLFSKGAYYEAYDQRPVILGSPVTDGRGGLGLSAGVRVAF